MTVPMIKSIGDVPYPIDTHSDVFSPLLTAGAALGITGDGPTETATWLQRVSTVDGPTTIRSIHGRTLRWNQLAPLFGNWNIKSGGTVTKTVSQDGRACQVTVATDDTAAVKSVYASGSFSTGHAYYLAVTVDATNLSSSSALYGLYETNSPTAVGRVLVESGASGRYSTIVTVGASVPSELRCGFGTSAPNGSYATFSDCICIDLTAMFGAGSEPSAAEFEAMYHASYYPYDAGSLLPVNMEGIETEDADGNPLQTRSIPAGILRSAGAGAYMVYDELTETERITRVYHVADVSTLALNSFNADSHYVTYILPVTGVNKATGRINVTCSKFAGATALTDGGCYVTNNGVTALFCNYSWTTREEAEAYMAGVEFDYELATYTVTPIDPPLNMTYRTEQGGTERVMVPEDEQSAPPTLVTAQGYTAESLRDAALSAIAPVENGTASTNYGVGSYLVHGGQLCRVTVAIASGEAITIGTNVVTTNVMAEVIALTQ